MAGTNSVLGGGGFHHLAVITGDFDRTVAFYRDVLALAPTRAWGEPGKRAAMLDTGDGSYLEVFERPAVKPAGDDGPMVHFALRTVDVDGVIARVRQAGYPVTVEPKDLAIPTSPKPVPVRLAFCKGPDGVQVEFLQEK